MLQGSVSAALSATFGQLASADVSLCARAIGTYF
jgi:hypothetical protein